MHSPAILLALLGACTLGCTNLDHAVTNPTTLERGPRLALGPGHTCMVVEGGGLDCWGDLESLADVLPDVPTVQFIRATALRTCALTRDRELWCREPSGGRDDDGRGETERVFTDVVDFDIFHAEGICAVHGNGEVSCRDRSTYRVRGVSGAVAVELGYQLGCARSAEGKVWCWRGRRPARRWESVEDAVDILVTGRDVFIVERSGEVTQARQMGAGQRVGALDDVVDVEAFEGSACALRSNGTVSCWRVEYWQRSSLFERVEEYELLQPIEIPDIDDAIELDVGIDHACVRGRDERIRCWGNNESFELGGTSGPWLAKPTRVDGIPPVVEVRVGRTHSCAIDRSGGLWCWGKPDGYLRWPIALDSAKNYSPRQIADSVTRVRADYDRATCAEFSVGDWSCWGNSSSLTPLPWPTSALAIGPAHSCVLLADQTTQCWGRNTGGEMGWISEFSQYDTPMTVPGLPPLTFITAGETRTCGLDHAGQAWCWGSYSTGTPPHELDVTPKRIPETPAFRSLTAGELHSCGLDYTGDVWCWGHDAPPRRIEGFEGITQIDAHGTTTCGVDLRGAVWCEGGNQSRQANPAAPTHSFVPVEVAPERRVRVIEP